MTNEEEIHIVEYVVVVCLHDAVAFVNQIPDALKRHPPYPDDLRRLFCFCFFFGLHQECE